jgi:hypothetical protein
MNRSKKKKLGQFFTTNYDYILQDMFIPEDIKSIIEPFTGNGDLLNFISKEDYKLECYDIDPKKDFIKKKDTIKNPPKYKDKFILTNPPYLARNKTKDKELFDKYDVNDLYKCFIKELITNKALGGIVIVPLNFWSSIRKSDIQLRKEFLSIYKVLQLNIFEERVFEDTSYTVSSFQFELKENDNEQEINILIYPSKIKIKCILNELNNYIIGGEIYNLENKKYKITRLTSKNKDKQNTNILVKCIDDNEKNKINISLVSDSDIYIDETPKQSARTYATLVIEPKIDIKKQKILIEKFNEFLNEKRSSYNSLFLTNYRESKDISRKRISFELVYDIVGYLLETI